MKARRALGWLLLLLVAAALGIGLWLYGGELLAQFERFRRSLRPTEPLAVTVIDVGQGSATLVQAGDADILIDCGERSEANRLTAELAAAGVRRLSAVVVTHLHTDHFGALVDLLGRFSVDAIILPETPDDLLPTNVTFERLLDAIERTKTPVIYQTAPQTILLSDAAALTFLDSFLETPDELNNTSLCLRIDCGSASFLITGDAERPVEAHLLETGALVDADVYIAGHHGSNSSSSQEFLNAVRPVVSAVSVGRGNDYELPSDAVIERLAAFGPVCRTDMSGTIRFLTDGETIRVTAAGIDETLTPRED